MVRRGSSSGLRPAARRGAAALLAVTLAFGAVGLHASVHDHSEAALPSPVTIAACAAHLATVHVEARRTVRVPECPACLLSHLNHGETRPLAPALALPTAEPGTAGPRLFVVVRLRDPSASPRAPPALPPASSLI